MNSIPYDLLREIGKLSGSMLIKADDSDVFKIHEIHSKIALDSQKVRGVSPIAYSNYTETLMSMLNKDIAVELILTENVLEKTVESPDSRNLENFKRSILENKLKVWEIKEDVKVAFMVTDNFLTLGLFSTNGLYDYDNLLINDNEDAVVWGNKLFYYYLKKAQKVDLEGLVNK